MSRDSSLAFVIGLAVLVVVIAAGAGAFATRRITSTAGPAIQIPEPAADGSTGVIFDLRQSGGLNLLGLQLRSTKSEVHVGLVAPSICVKSDSSGQQEVTDEGNCASLPAHGMVTGSGITSSGVAFVVVRVDVSKGCFEALSIGDGWPASTEDCES